MGIQYDADSDPRGSIGHTLAEAEEKIEADRNARYQKLVKSTENAGIRVNDLSADCKDKREILQWIYPARFGKDGKQDLSHYKPMEVGTIFRKVYSGAREKLTKG